MSQRLGYLSSKPRGFSSLGVFGSLDGNIIGGTLLGVGMALSAACPGTVFSQIALGIESGRWALLGGIFGGLFYTGWAKPYFASRQGAVATPAPQTVSGAKENLTVHEVLGVNRSTGFVLLQSALVGITALTLSLTPPGLRMRPVVGGLLIGVSQLVSILLRRSLLGTSGSFEELGAWLWGSMKRAGPRPASGSYTSILFCVGLVGGTWLVGAVAPDLAQTSKLHVGSANALAGGFLMVLGSRLAGGCTSGHGISGISLLSISSIVTIGTALVAGVLTQALRG